MIWTRFWPQRYTYCGLAALCILGEEHKLDLEALLDWLVHRQMTAEGGFQGRTNKLVDSCYTFWQGAIANLLHNSMGDRAPDRTVDLCASGERRHRAGAASGTGGIAGVEGGKCACEAGLV